MSDFKHSTLHPKGIQIEEGPDIGIVTSDTVMCVHCGGHWTVDPKHARGRGFCWHCNGAVCGPQCAECVPRERQLEILEGTDTRTRVTVATPIDVARLARRRAA